MQKLPLIAKVVAIACAFLTLGAGNSSAQVTFASVTGLVTDPGGAVIPGAEVELTNSDTGETRATTTGETGRFTMPQLKPGTYELNVETPGFKRFVRLNIRLQGSQDAEINAALELGEVTETVEVTAQAVLLDTQSANQTSDLNSEEITELPLNFRNPLLLVHANAGVNSAFQNAGRRSVQDRYNDQEMALFSMNGGREASNTITIDGVSNKGGAGDWGANFGTPSVDAVQEMQISRNTYDAQYGRVGNGVVSIVTKGGSDEFHGNVFWFHRNDNLDANEWRRNRAGNDRPEFKRNQYGVSASGPIWKQKRIYFQFGFEAMRQPAAASTNMTVPTELERAGDFSESRNRDGSLQEIYDPFTTRPNPDGDGFIRDRFAGNVIPATRMDPIGRNITSFIPTPNVDGVPVTNALNFFKTAPSNLLQDKWNGRFDYAPTSKFSTFFRVSRSLITANGARFFNNAADSGFLNDQPFYSVSVNNTYVASPTWVINFNAGSGGGHRTANLISMSEGVGLEDLGYSSSYAAQFENQDFGQYNITDYLFLGRTRFFGNIRRTHSGGITVANERGNHSIKLGFNIEFQRQNFFDRRTQQFGFNRGPTTGPIAVGNSAVVGNSMASMLLGVGGGSARLSADPAKQNVYMGWYVQDTWRATPKLTLILGLRYELQYGRTERYNRQGYFDYDAASPINDQVPGIDLRGGFHFSDPNNRNLTGLDTRDWAPRIGLSYKLTDKLVLRSGYGVSYSQAIVDGGITGMPGFDRATPWVLNPDGEVPVNTLSNPFPNGLSIPTGSADGLLTQLGLNIQAWRHHNPTPYLQSYSLDLQYELANGLLFDIGYTGNTGRKYSWGAGRNYNQVPSQYLSEGQALNNRVPNPFHGVLTAGPNTGETIPRFRLLRLFPHFNSVGTPRTEKGASTRFDALYLKLTRRFARGLTVLSSYQWSKAQDNASEDQGWFIGDGLRDQFDPSADYSISAHDIPHDFVTNLIWVLPIGRDQTLGGGMPKALDMVVGGWQIAGTIRFGSGVPINIRAPNTLGAFGYAVKRTNITSEEAVRQSNPSPERWFNIDAFSAPGQFEIGRAPRYMGTLRNRINTNGDISLGKYIDITERVRAQVRAEFFNITNTPVFGLPTSGGQVTLGSGAFGTVNRSFRPPRQIQMALKLIF
ncbi:MAG: TonB-dependent receptor [Bryobacterales bacterium]|nr:TonB-dependent receptor [Bryobacterales bacterium]